jgi:hypothetical protein
VPTGALARWLALAAIAVAAGVLHGWGLAPLLGWVPRPTGEAAVPGLLAGMVVAQALVTVAPAAVRGAALLGASLACGLLVSPSFTLGGVGWALAYRALLWSGARPRWTILFPIATVVALLTLADAAHLPSLSVAHPWLWLVSYLFVFGWFLRALVVWHEVRAGLPRPSTIDFLAYFLFAPFVLVPPYMLALPTLALVTDGVRTQDPAVVRSGLRWLVYALALQTAPALLEQVGLEPLTLFTEAARARDWLRAIPLAVLVYPGRAVLTGCAAGALLVGLVRVFGVPMGPPFRAPLLARGVADWWRRYNTHFRDLLVDLFWYPIALRHRRRPVRAAYLGCAAVFLVGSVPLHWPRAWALDGSPWSFPWHVLVECALMTALVGTSLVIEQRRARRPPAGPWSARAWAHRVATWLVICAVVLLGAYQVGYRVVYAPWERAAVAAERAATPAEAVALLPELEALVAVRPREPARRLALARMRALAGDVDGACVEVRRLRAFAVLAAPDDLRALARLDAGLVAPCPRAVTP